MTTGIAVDSTGGPVIDPTQNVKDLMEASIRSLIDRQNLLAQLSDEKIKRMESESIWMEKTAILTRAHYSELRHMESDRIDKIRSVDVANAAATATQLLTAVNNLATTQGAIAETLRNQVAATAQAAGQALSALINPIVERVATLEKSSYTGAGKQQVADPQMAELVLSVNKLLSGGDRATGKSEGLSLTAAIVMGAFTILFGVIGAGGVLYAVLKP